MHRRARYGFLAFALLVSSQAHAARPLPTRTDPAIAATFAYLGQHGVVPPWFDARPNPNRPTNMLPVLVRGVDQAALQRLVQAGEARWLHDGVPLASGAASLYVSEHAFHTLAAKAQRLSLDLPRRRLRPLDKSRAETGVNAAVRALLAKNGTLLDGTGVTIADIDSGIYVQHPSFFRADAGTFPWVDQNGDGKFTAGTDGVEVDGKTEVAELLTGYGVSFYDPSDVVLEESATLRPDVDFLYVDTDGNGERDYGKGFDESTPGYGEPLFVADDANGNGKLDVGERLLRLGSSKLRKIHTDKNRTRGDQTNGLNGWLAPSSSAEYTSHGTGVAGILVGGVWGQSRLLGLAPNADLLSYDYATKPADSQTGAVQWALDEKANVILTEYGIYTGYPLDGSSEEELLIDAAVQKGVVVADPAGNLVTGGKHRTVTATTAPLSVALATDDYFEGSQYVLYTILEHGSSSDLTITVSVPGVSSVTLGDATAQPVDIGGGFYAQVQREVTARQTTMRNVYVYGPDKMPMGAYALGLAAAAAPAGGVPLELYVSDTTSSWAYGITFSDATDAKTLCHPATADKALAVAAYTLHDEQGYYGSSAVGALATYSSSGPRYDGTPGIALAAPDNPLSTGIPEYALPGGEAASYAPFGGTSGAGPHVAASAALLRQAFPDETAEQLRTRLTSTARPVDGPDERWGHGKLDVAAALGIEVGTSAAPHDATIEAPADGIVVGRDNELHVAVTDDGTAFKTRWDYDYDGTPDTEWIDGLDGSVKPGATGSRAVRVYIADAEGNVTGATLVADVTAEPTKPTTDGGTGDDDDASDDGKSSSGCSCDTSASSKPAYGSALLALLAFIGVRRPRSRR